MYEGGEVDTVGCFSHISHPLQPSHLRLTTAQEMEIKNLIEDNQTSHQILKLLQGIDSKMQTKLFYLTREDIRFRFFSYV